MAAASEGDRRALARLLSIVERGGSGAREVGRLVFPRTGHAATLGITGAPGAGKSTLTSSLIGHLRALDLRVAVLAIDPSSPFSGGAILGDRVRMGDHVLDPAVFIRSMATRGHLGGLALAVPEAVRVLDAAGSDWVLVETVGVGQVEVDIVGQADTTVVVVNPGWGDAVQANKAGLMEIADVFVINKADRDGVRQTRHDLHAMIEMGHQSGGVDAPDRRDRRHRRAGDGGALGRGRRASCPPRRVRRARGEAGAAPRERVGRGGRGAPPPSRARADGGSRRVVTRRRGDPGLVDPYEAADRLLAPFEF